MLREWFRIWGSPDSRVGPCHVSRVGSWSIEKFSDPLKRNIFVDPEYFCSSWVLKTCKFLNVFVVTEMLNGHQLGFPGGCYLLGPGIPYRKKRVKSGVFAHLQLARNWLGRFLCKASKKAKEENREIVLLSLHWSGRKVSFSEESLFSSIATLTRRVFSDASVLRSL